MYPISKFFADYLRKREREFVVKAEVNGVEYKSGVLIDFSIENSLSLSDELELGTAIPSKLTIRFRTREHFPPNAKIVPYLSLSTAGLTWQEATYPWQDAAFSWLGGSTDWMPMGEFYIDKRTEDRGVWTYTCYDKLVFADVPYISQLNYPATMKAVWDEICNRLGFKYDSSVQINSSYRIQAGPAGYSCRQVLGYIASANNACIYIDKTGILKFRKIAKSNTPVFEMLEGDYIRAKQTNPLKTYTRVVVEYNTEDGLFYEAGSGDENHTLYIENPFATQAITNAILAQINGFSYVPVSMPARGFPQLEQGDIITFERVDSTPWIETVTSWQDTQVPWDGNIKYQTIILHQVFNYKGGLSMQIEAPSVSEQQSEFKVDGTLEGQINRLNKNALKEGRSYYGATITRTEGLIIERQDNKSKVILNSDKLSFQANGQDRIYFDPVAGRYKFNGTLEATDGIFSGNLQAAGGSFTGELVAASGTFRGALQAASGTFAGNLSAAGGTFTGELVAASGTFRGSLQAASGTFTGNLSAAGGTFTGTLVGVDGNFSGTITASHISGSTIQGGSISIGSGFSVNSAGFMTATGANLSGGSITGAANINVSKDVYIGHWLYLDGSSFNSGIYFADGIQITYEPSGGGLYLRAFGGIYANGKRLDL